MKSFEELLAASSLGTPGAQAVRALTPDEDVARIMEMLKALERRENAISDDEYYSGVLAAKSLLDGTKREVHLRQMIFNLRLSTTSEPQGFYYEEEFCYHDDALAWEVFETWDGDSVPPGFAKNASTGERGPGFRRER